MRTEAEARSKIETSLFVDASAVFEVEVLLGRKSAKEMQAALDIFRTVKRDQVERVQQLVESVGPSSVVLLQRDGHQLLDAEHAALGDVHAWRPPSGWPWPGQRWPVDRQAGYRVSLRRDGQRLNDPRSRRAAAQGLTASDGPGGDDAAALAATAGTVPRGCLRPVARGGGALLHPRGRTRTRARGGALLRPRGRARVDAPPCPGRGVQGRAPGGHAAEEDGARALSRHWPSEGELAAPP